MDKETLRREAINRRMEMSEGLRSLKSAKIIRRLEELEEFKRAKHLLAYYSINAEVQTSEMLAGWSAQKKIYLPKLVNENTFIAVPYDTLAESHYGIFEPIGGEEATKIDMILVPAVAYDRLGSRLGMGKGYYDRFLAKYKDILKVGLAYSEQILASIPKATYDVGVDLIITDEELIRIK